MPFRIQRVPRGLNELLSIFGGATPTELEDRVRTILDALQMYGLSQRQVLTASNAALTEGTALGIAFSATQWSVLFGAELQIAKTGTMTALRGSIRLQRTSSSSVTIAAEELGPFGATETGTVRLPFWAPYPILVPPNSFLFGRADIIGTDANCNATIAAEFGLVGP